MGACDPGRCCKGATCTSDKKCCCQAKKGTHTAGEVCRTSSCTTNGTCENNVPICACLNGGGTLTQACDPCDGYTCNAAECKTCVVVNGQPTCVSYCTDLCSPCVNGACIPKQCGACEQCIAGSCVSTGTPCGTAPNITCCGSGQCCVNGQCVSSACASACGPCELCVCGTCQYQSGEPCGASCCQGTDSCCDQTVCCPQGRYCCSGVCCPTGQRCCGTACKECCVDAHCPSGKVCDNGVCVTLTCCKWEPACAPGGFGSYVSGGLCDPRGTEECPVVITPVRCSDARCQYEWDGSAWINPKCVALLQGSYVEFSCNCTASGCTPPSSSGAVVGDIDYGGSCATASNPLP